jgi:hypothetical protein
MGCGTSHASPGITSADNAEEYKPVHRDSKLERLSNYLSDRLDIKK